MSQWQPRSLAEYLAMWQLEPDGAAFSTRSSHLQPVRRHGLRAMLKVARIEEEGRGSQLLAWFAGSGAAPVLEHDDFAVLIAWAPGERSLAALSTTGRDDEATRVLAETGLRLHAATADREPPRGLITLDRWFRDLFAREGRGGPWARAASLAHELLAAEGDDVVLHGDLHHGNVLDFGATGWLAIDPKFLIGNRIFDYTNILCNPSAELAETHFDARLGIISAVAGIERDELLAWTVAWTALSASWAEETDPDWARTTMRIGSLAAERLSLAATE